MLAFSIRYQRSATWTALDSAFAAAHRPVNHEGRDHLIVAQARHESGRFPMPVRHAADQSQAARAAAAKPHHVG